MLAVGFFGLIIDAGVLADPTAPSNFFEWLTHTATHHPGAITFVMSDFFLFFGVAVLTVVQASQVCLHEKFYIVVITYFVMSTRLTELAKEISGPSLDQERFLARLGR